MGVIYLCYRSALWTVLGDRDIMRIDVGMEWREGGMGQEKGD